MIRNLFRFLILIAVVAFIRYLIGMITRAVSSAVNPNPQAESGPSKSQGPREENQGELLRDPVCGVFVASATSVKKSVGGETVHFCSTACRDKYLVKT